ncbi:MAG: hypothetical protein GXO58_00020 [Thermodesulfobacteria bacterium]|nr:hypothetical protein [Thermodesulfobacteriota bacterium]
MAAAIIVLLCACSQAEKQSHFVVLQQGSSLIVELGNSRCKLSDDARAYQVYLSPSGRLIVVEAQILSNLTILRLYERSNGCFKEVEPSLAEKLWHQVAQEQRFKVDEIQRARMKFMGWKGQESFEVRLEGVVQGKEIRVILTVP